MMMAHSYLQTLPHLSYLQKHKKNFLKSKLFPGKTPNNSTSSGHTNLRVLPASKHFYMKSARAPVKSRAHTPKFKCSTQVLNCRETQPSHPEEEEIEGHWPLLFVWGSLMLSSPRPSSIHATRNRILNPTLPKIIFLAPIRLHFFLFLLL